MGDRLVVRAEVHQPEAVLLRRRRWIVLDERVLLGLEPDRIDVAVGWPRQLRVLHRPEYEGWPPRDSGDPWSRDARAATLAQATGRIGTLHRCPSDS
jgi:hypothetical protein